MDYQDWDCSPANGFNPIILKILILTIPPLTIHSRRAGNWLNSPALGIS